MSEKLGPQESAALFVLALERREIPNAEFTKSYKIKLAPASREKMKDLIEIRTRPLAYRITKRGIGWCRDELNRIEAPSNSGPLGRALYGLVRSLAEGKKLDDLIPPTDLPSLIRAAYRELSVKPQDWVRLAMLRPRIPDSERSEVDGELLAMVKAGRAHLVPDSNRKALTEEDRAAAIRVGSEDRHLVAIEES